MSDSTSAPAVHTATQVRYANLHIFSLTFLSFSSDLRSKTVISPVLISEQSHIILYSSLTKSQTLKSLLNLLIQFNYSVKQDYTYYLYILYTWRENMSAFRYTFLKLFLNKKANVLLLYLQSPAFILTEVKHSFISRTLHLLSHTTEAWQIIFCHSVSGSVYKLWPFTAPRSSELSAHQLMLYMKCL